MRKRFVISALALLVGILSTASCSSLKRMCTVDSGYSGAAYYDSICHPSGTLVEKFYPSSTKQGPGARRMLVYLPDGYESSEESYPVLYLIHGARGNEQSWIKDGDALHTLDSLRTANLCSDFILVLPNLNQYDDDEDFGESRFKRPIESFFEIDGTVESAFFTDVVEFVDRNFRTIPDKQHRALAGLSIGALQAIYISADNPDAFDYIGLFSPMYKAFFKKSECSDFYRDLNQRQEMQFANPPQLYFIQIGKADIFYSHITDYRIYLNKNGFDYQYREYEGGHTWTSWKKYFEVFAKRIFIQ